MSDCPSCQSSAVFKNGHIHNGKRRFCCHECGRQFVEDPQNAPLSREKQELVDRLLLEKIPLAGIARAAQVSPSWLQTYVNRKYRATPQQVTVKKKGDR